MQKCTCFFDAKRTATAVFQILVTYIHTLKNRKKALKGSISESNKDGHGYAGKQKRKGKGLSDNHPTHCNTERSRTLKNEKAIANIGLQLGKVAERICTIACGMEELRDSQPDLADTYEHFIIDEVTHVQILALELTRLATEEEGGNADDSAFAEGELTSVIGEKKKDPEE